MALVDTVKSVAQNLQQGRYASEKAISLQVVSVILRELGWDTTDPGVVRAEYSVGVGRVDYALFHPPDYPRVFVEVKQPRTTEGADEQLFGYSVQVGVGMLVLTDGRSWSFYLPGEEGSFEDRRVYRLNLTEREPEVAAEDLKRYLGWARVADGSALEDARKELRDRNRRKQAARFIPAAWKNLVENEDQDIFNKLAIEVEAKCGIKPDQDDIATFLRGLSTAPPVVSTPTAAAAVRPTSPTVSSGTGPSFTLLGGQPQTFRNGQQMMAGALRALAERDPSFPEKCYSHPENIGRLRRYIGRSPKELYPERPDLEGYSIEFMSGWYVQTNVSTPSKEKILRMACEAAGLRYGTDLKVTF